MKFFCNNKLSLALSTIRFSIETYMLNNLPLTTCTKHVEVDRYFIKEILTEDRELVYIYINKGQVKWDFESDTRQAVHLRHICSSLGGSWQVLIIYLEVSNLRLSTLAFMFNPFVLGVHYYDF